MSFSETKYTYIKQVSMPEDSGNRVKESFNELAVSQLSGDEAMEDSFAKDSINSAIFQGNEKSSLFQSGVAVMNTMVGVGILGLPNVAKNFGILPMTLLVLFVFVSTNFSTNLLIRCKNLSGRSNYTTIGYYIYPTKTIIVVINLIIIFCNLGNCLSILIVFGTTFENLVSVISVTQDDITNSPFYLQRWFYMIIIGFLLFPLITVRQIERLHVASLIAILSVTSFCFIIIWNFGNQYINDDLALDYGLFPTKFDIRLALGCLPNVILAFNWLFNLFPIYKGMVNPSDSRIKISAWMGSSLATVLQLTVAILGYMTYGSQVKTNFLETIQSKDVGKPLYILLNVTFTLSTIFTLPLLFYGSRNNCISLINLIKSETSKSMVVQEIQELPILLLQEDKTIQFLKINALKRSEKIKFYSTSLILEVMLIIGAIYFTQLDVVFNLLGAVGSNSIATGLPALFYFKCVEKNIDIRLLKKNKRLLYHFVKGYFYYSIVLVVLCVGSEILKITQNVK